MTRTYVGHYEGGFGWVEIHCGRLVFPLSLPSDAREAGFLWGGPATESTTLAESLLTDVLGGAVPEHLATVFTADVLAHLPRADFRMDEWEIRRWLAGSRPRRMEAAELVEHLGRVAVADPDEEAEILRELLARCWDATTLCQ